MTTAFSRRGLLKIGLSAAAATGVLSATAGYDLIIQLAPAAVPGGVLSVDERTLVATLAKLYFPPGNAIGIAADPGRIAQQLDDWLASTPPVSPDVARYGLHAIDASSLPTQGARFSELSEADQLAWLETLAGSESTALMGIEQLARIFVSLFYFEEPEVLAALGTTVGCAL